MIIAGTCPGRFQTLSDVLAADGYMYFQGTDHAVWRVSTTNPADNTNYGGPEVVNTWSNVFPADDGYLYFRGRDNQVWRLNATDPEDRGNPGGFQTRSAVFAVGGYMYFQGTDHAVWRVSTTNPADNTNYGGPSAMSATSSVFPADDGYLYFRGLNGRLWRVNIADPGDRSNPGGLTIQSNPFAADGFAYFQGAGRRVSCYGFGDGAFADYVTAAVVTLQNWYNPERGVWEAPEGPGWWNSANALYALIDYMSLTGTRGYLHVMQNTFDRNSARGFINEYYDDEGWWALAWIAAFDLIGDRKYLDMAESIFADMTTGWTADTCGGGLLWKKGITGKNSIENELFLAVAVRLYQRVPAPGRPAYLDWINKAAEWFHDAFIAGDPGDLISDGLDIDGQGRGTPRGPHFTYTQGVIIGALTDMDTCGLAFAGQAPLSLARRIADAVAASPRLVSDGVLTEWEYVPDSVDLPQFKGIYMRGLGCLAARVGSPGNEGYVSFITRNARVLLADGRDAGNRFGYRWQDQPDRTDAIRQTSALEALNAALRVGVPGQGEQVIH
jgi:predicted alpha-1,6-mannanase (GH76 family)